MAGILNLIGNCVFIFDWLWRSHQTDDYDVKS